MGPNDIFISITDFSTGVYKVKRCVHNQQNNSHIMAFNICNFPSFETNKD